MMIDEYGDKRLTWLNKYMSLYTAERTNIATN